ncbi:hypothetical protein E2C01_008269 [Portunus trituberculatus]|uniref:Uncharacterized protein n=1 Tax=Portunus trituberculatus TaxID=210409 RepID=A0A5B7D4A4_PORTR|nr:hypothetical protein [Portunus trituberculatus]
MKCSALSKRQHRGGAQEMLRHCRFACSSQDFSQIRNHVSHPDLFYYYQVRHASLSQHLFPTTTPSFPSPGSQTLLSHQVISGHTDTASHPSRLVPSSKSIRCLLPLACDGISNFLMVSPVNQSGIS